MCLYINTKVHKKQKGEKFPAPFIADENILVFKFLIKQWVEKKCWYLTPYQTKIITFNENNYCLVKSDLIDIFCPFGIQFSQSVLDNKRFYKVFEGIHSYYEDNADDWGEKHYAIIPKGTKFYIGDSGDIVSQKLIIFKNQNAYKQYLKENKITANVWHYNCNNEK